MKSIIASFLVLASLTTLASEVSREMSLPAEWDFIVCKQLENGGMTIQRRNLEAGDKITIKAPAYQLPVYEISKNGQFIASCAFIAIK
ncbi:MAG: hypothetical protein K9K67_11890 [Bacteriovoracaceae bacterium]|nr:hypothetical protein [Bacteriovoracaceae bacterium]